MRRYILTLMIAFYLAILSADGYSSYKPPPPIVYYMDRVPVYGRRRALKRHYVPFYQRN